jgi:hypothetical protein
LFQTLGKLGSEFVGRIIGHCLGDGIKGVIHFLFLEGASHGSEAYGEGDTFMPCWQVFSLVDVKNGDIFRVKFPGTGFV